MRPQTPVLPYISVGQWCRMQCGGPRLRHSITSAVRPGPLPWLPRLSPAAAREGCRKLACRFFPGPRLTLANIWSQTSALRLCRTAGASLAPICRRPRRPPHLCPASPELRAGSHGPARAVQAPICRGGCPGGGCFREVRAQNKARVLASSRRVLLRPKSLQERGSGQSPCPALPQFLTLQIYRRH